MPSVKRGKIIFDLPNSFSKEQAEKLADNTINKLAPKVTKLKRKETKKPC